MADKNGDVIVEYILHGSVDLIAKVGHDGQRSSEQADAFFEAGCNVIFVFRGDFMAEEDQIGLAIDANEHDGASCFASAVNMEHIPPIGLDKPFFHLRCEGLVNRSKAYEKTIGEVMNGAEWNVLSKA